MGATASSYSDEDDVITSFKKDSDYTKKNIENRYGYAFSIKDYINDIQFGVTCTEYRIVHSNKKWLFPPVGLIATIFNNVNILEKYYFDTASGDLINESTALSRIENNKQADNLFEEGQTAYKKNDFIAAFNKFKQAYQKCSKNYINEKRFKEWMDYCELKLNERKHSTTRANIETQSDVNKAMKLNEDGLKIYEEGKLKEFDEKFELAIKKYNEAAEKFKEAYLVKKLEEIFKSFILVLEGYIRTKSHQKAFDVLKFIEDKYPEKKEFLKGLKDNLNQNNWSIDHLSQYLEVQRNNKKLIENGP